MANFILIHGGFCGGWYWKKVKKALELAGHIVHTPTLTGLGQYCHLNGPHINLDTHIQDISNFLFFEDIKKAILVGHSYGGLVITGAACQNASQIDQLIYLDGLIPESGDSLMSLVDAQTAQFFTTQTQEKGSNWFVPPPTNIQLESTSDITWFNKRLTPQSFNSFTQPLLFEKQVFETIKSSFIFCTKSTHETIIRMARKAHSKEWNYLELQSDHFPMIDAPEKLSSLLEIMV